MYTIRAESAEAALDGARALFHQSSTLRSSRNGEMREVNEPVTTIYEHPRRRVVFCPDRDANPFFHFFESLWMLAGRNDVAFPAEFVARIKDYSDDGETLHGAYGARWRSQLPGVIARLKDIRADRRVLIAMWDLSLDFLSSSKDVPCNTHIYFKVRDGRLNMTVCCRSNDAIWGAYGANVVHMSMLMEYLAGHIGVMLGTYRQVSDSLHIYPKVPVADRWWRNGFSVRDNYPGTFGIMEGVEPEEWDADLETFFRQWRGDDTDLIHDKFTSPFFRFVVIPMADSHLWYRKKRFDLAFHCAGQVAAGDWKRAAQGWLTRRDPNAKS